jgi:hypothetical protein
MVNYTCEKCNKEFSKKCHYLTHINKKRPCEININTPDFTPVIQQIPPIINNLGINDKNICLYCNAIFTRKDHLKRHIEERCKVKKIKEDDEEKDKENIFKLLLAKEEEIKKINENNKELENYVKKLTDMNKNLQKNYKKLEKIYSEFENTNINLPKKINKLEKKINEYNTEIINKDKQIDELININSINNNLIKYEEINNESDNDNESNNLIIENNIIMSRESDKYINATQLCKAGNKKFNDWFRLDNTKILISVLESEAGIPASQLVDIKKGRSSKFEQGVWLHPDLAIQIAQWINPKFALQVSKWIRTLFSKGKVNFKLIKKQEEKINRSTKKIKELESMVLKKQKREIYPESNVIYMLTTHDHKKRNIYIIGKAINLTDRLSTYNKTCDHEVIYYKKCEDEENMDLSEKLILKKLEKYREVANRDRFILPAGEDIKLFTDIINKYT